MEGLYRLYASMVELPDENPQAVTTQRDICYQTSPLPPQTTATSFGIEYGTSEHHFAAAGSSSAISDAASYIEAVAQEEDDDDAWRISIRAKIASHPLYPKLLEAYIDCHKVGAPPEVAEQLDVIRRESKSCRRKVGGGVTAFYGSDPELDDFMETYHGVLVKYKSDLLRPFEDATSFLNDIQNQLNALCNVSASTFPYEACDGGPLEEDLSGGDIDVPEQHESNKDRELKDELLCKYSGYIGTLKYEFSKKKKKAKLPNEARQLLHDWWSVHYKWPYPTEADKRELAEATGLDQKQINNWFINQRKRHWKPLENMQSAVMEGLYGPLFMNEK